MKIKQKAISVLEALILVMLTSLIVAMSFVIYVNMNKSYLFAEATTGDFIEVVVFKRVLGYDWNTTKTNRFVNENELMLDMVTYTFEDKEIIRSTPVTVDTFELITTELLPHFISPQTTLCDSLTIEFAKKTHFFRLDLHYQPDHKTLLELEY